MRYLLDHQWILWPLASILYVSIGTPVGLYLYWRYCRHQYEKHNWRGGIFETLGTEGCWCYEGDLVGSVALPVVYLSPILWPLCLAGIILSVPFSVITALYKKVEKRANWDGKSVENSLTVSSHALCTSVECSICKAKYGEAHNYTRDAFNPNCALCTAKVGPHICTAPETVEQEFKRRTGRDIP